MPRSSDILFVSSNRHKYEEARSVLGGLGIAVDFAESELLEIQSDSLADVALAKARDASAAFGRPVLVEDDGLFVDGLNGFPGPYSSYVLRTIGLAGMLRLLAGSGDRRARFVAAVAYDDGGGDGDGGGSNSRSNGNNNSSRRSSSSSNGPGRVFEASVCGVIPGASRGDGWGYDPLFVPTGHALTFAEMGARRKAGISHRALALGAFAGWYRGGMP